jgi:hypothetical protein
LKLDSAFVWTSTACKGAENCGDKTIMLGGEVMVLKVDRKDLGQTEED